MSMSRVGAKIETLCNKELFPNHSSWTCPTKRVEWFWWNLRFDGCMVLQRLLWFFMQHLMMILDKTGSLGIDVEFLALFLDPIMVHLPTRGALPPKCFVTPHINAPSHDTYYDNIWYETKHWRWCFHSHDEIYLRDSPCYNLDVMRPWKWIDNIYKSS